MSLKKDRSDRLMITFPSSKQTEHGYNVHKWYVNVWGRSTCFIRVLLRPLHSTFIRARYASRIWYIVTGRIKPWVTVSMIKRATCQRELYQNFIARSPLLSFLFLFFSSSFFFFEKLHIPGHSKKGSATLRELWAKRYKKSIAERSKYILEKKRVKVIYILLGMGYGKNVGLSEKMSRLQSRRFFPTKLRNFSRLLIKGYVKSNIVIIGGLKNRGFFLGKT